MTWGNLHLPPTPDWAATLPLSGLRQLHLDWFLQQGVPPLAIVQPSPIMVAKGNRAHDGYFDHDPEGPDWITIEESNDLFYWRVKTGELASEFNRGFALGEDILRNPGETAFGQPIRIFASPLPWFRQQRRGLVILHWDWTFDYLRDVEHVAVDPAILPIFQRHMKPKRLPKVSLLQVASSITVAS